MQLSDQEKFKAYGDPETREKLRADLDLPESGFYKRWDLIIVEEPHLANNRPLKGKHIAEIAKAQGRDPFDFFVELVVEEELNTRFAFATETPTVMRWVNFSEVRTLSWTFRWRSSRTISL
jgi:N-acyl-D-aspartate/D-glutamate deacylase